MVWVLLQLLEDVINYEYVLINKEINGNKNQNKLSAYSSIILFSITVMLNGSPTTNTAETKRVY